MKKSIIKNISLGIACLLGLGSAITAGVLSTNSPSFNNAEATAAYKPYGIVFDSNLVDKWKPNKADATSGSAMDGMWTWSNSTGVTFNEANFIYIQSSTGNAKGTYKHLKFTIQSGGTAQIAFHNNKEINLTGAGVDMYCDKELSMSVHDNIGKINIAKDITGQKTRDTNEPGSAFVYGTTGSGLGVESYCDTMYIDFTNNQSSTAVIYICSIQVYIEDHMATYKLNGGQFPNGEYLNAIYCIGNKLYLYDYYDPSKIMTPTANPITIPVKEGYVFKGFYKEDTFENIFIDETGYLVDGIDHQFTSPFNLYAKWAPAGQPVTIAAGTGVSNVFLSTSDTATSGDPSGTSYPEGTTVYAYVDLKPGYKPVTEWGNPISGSIYKIPTSHVMTDQPYDFGTHDADGKYTYNITYNLNGGNLEADNPSTFDVETATFTLNNPTKTGYIFTGWTGTGLTELTTTVTISQGSIGDRSYTANWTAIDYTISYNLDGGSVSPSNPTGYTVDTATFTLTNPTRDGYTFKGWSGTDLTGDDNKTVTITQGSIGNRNYTANWTPAEYQIIFARNGGTGGTAGKYVTYLQEMPPITPPTKEHCTFIGYWDWDGVVQYYNADGTSAHIWDKTTNYSLQAHYQFNIEFNSVTGNVHPYDGAAHSYETITFQYVDGSTIHTINENELDSLMFSDDGGATYTLTDKPTFTELGEHTVYYQASKTGYTTLTGQFNIVINKDTPIINEAPTAIGGLEYNTTAQAIIHPGSATGGTLYYRLSTESTWSEVVPAVVEPGTYSVEYYVKGDANHNDTDIFTIDNIVLYKGIFPLDHPENVLTPKVLSYNEHNQALVTVDDSEIVDKYGTLATLEYSLDEHHWSATIPEAKDAGTYTVFFRLKSNDTEHYADYRSNTWKVEVTISKVDPSYIVPTGLVGSNDSTLSTIELPDGWSWVNPNENTRSVGEGKIFKANYIVSDTSYNPIYNIDVPVNIVHVHDFTYVASGASITASCHNPECPITTGLTITMEIGDNLVYDGNAKVVNFATGYNQEAFVNPTIKYYQGDKEVEACINAGTYEARLTYGDTTAKLVFVINKANPTGYVVPSDIESPYDTELNKVALPEGFSWMDGTQKTSTWGENTFKAKYTPSDTTNYNVVENVDVKVNVKWIIADPTAGDVSVTINDGETAYNVDISVKVEVKTEVTVDQKRNKYASLATKGFVNSNEDISAIYGVKLIRTTNGVEEEIQPSDIKPGTKITVSMAIPEELIGKEFKLLHIHNAEDITVVDDYAISKDGKTLILEIDRLSDFAFVSATDADNGFIYNNGLPLWGLILIIVGSILLLALLGLLIVFIFFPVYYIDKNKNKIRKAIYIRTKNDEVIILNGWLKRMKFKEADVYEKKSDALNALNK